MDLLLKRVNLDMKLTCYGALATGASSGIVQFVEDSKAISDILAENQSSILNYLRANNPDTAAPGGVMGRARASAVAAEDGGEAGVRRGSALGSRARGGAAAPPARLKARDPDTLAELRPPVAPAVLPPV